MKLFQVCLKIVIADLQGMALLIRRIVCDPISRPPDGGHEPIAIVGMAMRLPGGIDNAEDFWDLLINRKDGVCEVPGSRYNVDSFYDPYKLGSVRTKHGYYLKDDPAQFDRTFFSMSKFEASKLDPQQRLLLEVVWECMENSGQTEWRGSDIGCFVGVFGEDWLDICSKDPQGVDRYHVLSTGDFALSNRISYEFDLHGPRYAGSVAVILQMLTAFFFFFFQHNTQNGMLILSCRTPRSMSGYNF